jgi:uncharacterized protein YbjT (DUF2867 family)
MYAITAITGRVGGSVARHLLAAGHGVRAIVRDANKGRVWTERGCDVALADMTDAVALEAAFSGVDGAFVLLPPNFDPSPGFPESRAIIAALRQALERARPQRVVVLSTIGAQATESNLLSQLGLMEQALRTLAMPVHFLRPAWFLENAAWDLEPARTRGVVPSFLQPFDRAIPMVASDDVGRALADMLTSSDALPHVVELEGPARVSPNDMAAAWTRLLDRDVVMEVVPRAGWEALFRSQGMNHPLPRMRMLDGFNEGWIRFENDAVVKGTTTLDAVLRGFVTDPD